MRLQAVAFQSEFFQPPHPVSGTVRRDCRPDDESPAGEEFYMEDFKSFHQFFIAEHVDHIEDQGRIGPARQCFKLRRPPCPHFSPRSESEPGDAHPFFIRIEAANRSQGKELQYPDGGDAVTAPDIYDTPGLSQEFREAGKHRIQPHLEAGKHPG